MDTMLFTARSIWTMIHGIVLGGGALLGLAAALFSLATMRVMKSSDLVDATARSQARYLGWLLGFVALALWSTVLIGTYINFPDYRAVPPEGLADLARYPKSLIQSRPGTAWLHSLAMETKEHVPWITAMLATGAAYVGIRERSRLLCDAQLRRMMVLLLGIAFILVSIVSLLGVFVNKVAPLE
jgi:hypothetical protein